MKRKWCACPRVAQIDWVGSWNNFLLILTVLFLKEISTIFVLDQASRSNITLISEYIVKKEDKEYCIQPSSFGKKYLSYMDMQLIDSMWFYPCRQADWQPQPLSILVIDNLDNNDNDKQKLKWKWLSPGNDLA